MIELDIYHLEYKDAIRLFTSCIQDFSDIECHINFRADHSQSKIIRDIIGMTFDRNNIHAPWRGRFVLIADELVNNAIEHGSQADDINLCVFRLDKKIDDSFYVAIEVHDTGRGKDSIDIIHMEALKKEKHETNGVYMEKRGRGLFYITERLVDRLSFSKSAKGGLAVKIEKTIPISGK